MKILENIFGVFLLFNMCRVFGHTWSEREKCLICTMCGKVEHL